ASPEERAISAERATRAAEALRRLKPQELRAMWLKALGHSYAEIGQATGYSATKVNRCLAEGRKSFLERFEGIEAGEECRRWQTVLSAMVDGEATAAQLTEVRPHLRNCPACRATLRRLHGHGRSLGAVLPVGIAGAGVKLAGLLGRLLPGVATSDGGGAVAAGGAGVFGIGGAKLAGLLAAGAAATAGGGLVAVREGGTEAVHHRAGRPAGVVARRVAGGREPVGAAPLAAGASGASGPVTAPAVHDGAAARPAATAHARHRPPAHRLVARRSSAGGRVEFAPAGGEPAPASPTAAVAAAPHAAATPPSSRHSAPRAATGGADAVRGEFAPHP
ncbi:MAG TPA: zf-HC2 domain-containing protein, partial [Baekduia sp.]